MLCLCLNAACRQLHVLRKLLLGARESRKSLTGEASALGGISKARSSRAVYEQACKGWKYHLYVRSNGVTVQMAGRAPREW